MNTAGPVIAQKLIQLCEGVGIVSIPVSINDVEPLACVSVKQV